MNVLGDEAAASDGCMYRPFGRLGAATPPSMDDVPLCTARDTIFDKAVLPPSW